MKLSPTSLFGILGAVALAVSQVSGLPGTLHMVCVCVSAACVAGLGYHASDATPRPPAPPLLMFALLLGIAVVVFTGCKVGGLGVAVNSPAFGSVGITLDGGVIGHGRMPTNAIAALPKP